jgi:hypothetical protein
MEPPCRDCIPEDIHPWNENAITIFGASSDQWMIASNGYKLGLKNTEVEAAMRIIGINEDDKQDTFFKVKHIARIVATLQNNKNFPE